MSAGDEFERKHENPSQGCPASLPTKRRGLRMPLSLAPPPLTKIDPVTEIIHGVAVADPYRWLEDQNSPRTREWLEKQTAYTRSEKHTSELQPHLNFVYPLLLKKKKKVLTHT